MSKKVCVILLPKFNYDNNVESFLTQELLEKVKPTMLVADHIKPTNEDLTTINNRFIIKGISRNVKHFLKPGDDLYTMFLECDREEVLYAIYSDSRRKQKIEKIFHNNVDLCDMIMVFKEDESAVLADFYREYVNKRAVKTQTDSASV